MADGGEPTPPSVHRKPLAACEWSALLVSRQALLDRGVSLDQRIPMLDPREPPADALQSCRCGRCRTCAKRRRTREARRAAKLTREDIAAAPDLERVLYRYSYDALALPRPPSERDPAPSHRGSLRADHGGPDNGVRYPVISDYTSEAAHFGFFDFRKLGATNSDEISHAANWLSSRDGFRRVDPFWSRRAWDATRRRQAEHLERDAEGRAIIQPLPLADLLLDYPDPTTHDVVMLVHDVVSIYCGPRGETRVSQWVAGLPRARWAEALWIHRHSTPKRRGGNGRLSIPSLIDHILQHGCRENVPDYRADRKASTADEFAATITVDWLARLARPETALVRPSAKASKRMAAARAAKSSTPENGNDSQSHAAA